MCHLLTLFFLLSRALVWWNSVNQFLLSLTILLESYFKKQKTNNCSNKCPKVCPLHKFTSVIVCIFHGKFLIVWVCWRNSSTYSHGNTVCNRQGGINLETHQGYVLQIKNTWMWMCRAVLCALFPSVRPWSLCVWVPWIFGCHDL